MVQKFTKEIALIEEIKNEKPPSIFLNDEYKSIRQLTISNDFISAQTNKISKHPSEMECECGHTLDERKVYYSDIQPKILSNRLLNEIENLSVFVCPEGSCKAAYCPNQLPYV